MYDLRRQRKQQKHLYSSCFLHNQLLQLGLNSALHFILLINFLCSTSRCCFSLETRPFFISSISDIYQTIIYNGKYDLQEDLKTKLQALPLYEINLQRKTCPFKEKTKCDIDIQVCGNSLVKMQNQHVYMNSDMSDERVG